MRDHWKKAHPDDFEAFWRTALNAGVVAGTASQPKAVTLKAEDAGKGVGGGGTALEIVLMGRTPYVSPWGGGKPGDWSAVRRAMQATNVDHLADRLIEELSGGERQRVILAQALAQDAPVLLLDEPTTHLDLLHVLEILAVVRELADVQGKAVLSIFHDLNLAAATCDRMYVLSRGRMVAEGPPDRVLTRSLLADVYRVEAEVVPNSMTGRPMVALGPLTRPIGDRPSG